MTNHQPEKVSDVVQAVSSNTAHPLGGIRFLYVVVAAGALLFAVYYVVRLVRLSGLGQQFTPSYSVNLEQPGVASDDASLTPRAGNPSLRVAIAPVISPEKSIEIYRDLAHYLADQMEREAVVLQRATYAEINELVRYRRCDVALVCTYPFIRGEQDFGMETLVVPQVKGAITYHSLILVPLSSEAKSLWDLRDKRFACADIMSNSGWLYPATWLLSRGEDPDSFFSDVLVAGSHDRSIQAVVSGYVEGAAVDSLVYDTMAGEDPSVLTLTRVVQKSPPFGMPPLAVHPQMDPDLKSQLMRVLLDMHADPEGGKILTSIGIDKFVVADPAIYDSVRKSAELWESR
jgi:phosphonate transport system substrate-binding protein